MQTPKTSLLFPPPNMRPNPLLSLPVLVKRPDMLTVPTVLRTERTNAKLEYQRLFRKECAKTFLGTLTPTTHLFGLTKGQFSLVDVIREISDQIGQCNFALSTWTVARADLAELQQLVSRARFLSVRFLLDMSFQRRQPAMIQHLRQHYGNGAICVTRNHCKFAIFGNDNFQLTCRTSMNLNFNPRLEDVEIKGDPVLYQFLNTLLDDLFSRHDPATQANKSTAQLAADFARD